MCVRRCLRALWLARSRLLAGLPWLLLACIAPLAEVAAQTLPTLEINAAGPSLGNGPTVADQTVTLQTNTDNSTGNTFAASTAPISVTFSLSNQQYTGLTEEQGFPASTGGNAVVWGGFPTFRGILMRSTPILTNMGALGRPLADMYTSAGSAATGTGMSMTDNGGLWFFMSTRALAVREVPTSSRPQMMDLTIGFSRPVTNPILHFVDLGGSNGNQGFASEYELLTPGLSLTLLSGNSVMSVAGGLIRSTSTNVSADCPTVRGACGSVRVEGVGITTVAFRAYLRGTGGTSWSAATQNVGEGVVISVSLDLPPRLRLSKAVGPLGRVQPDDQFVLSIANSQGQQASATTAGAGSVATGTATVAGGTPGQVYTLSESMAAATNTPLAAYAGNIACTNAATTGTVLPSGSGNSFTVTAGAADDIDCTLTNTARQVQVRLAKAWAANSRTGDVAQIGATQRLGTNTAVFTSNAGTDTSGAAVSALGGQTLQLPAEVMATGSLANYSTTIACDQGATPSGTNGQMAGQTLTLPHTLAENALVTCTYTNRAHQAHLRIFKTNTPGQNEDVDQLTDTVTSGASVTYTIKVNNQGPDAVNGAIVTDAVGEGLQCPADGVVAITGDGVPAGSFSVAQLTNKGIALGTLANGQTATLQYSCQVL